MEQIRPPQEILNPEYDKAYYNRGNVKSDLKNCAGAIADYSKAIAINPNYSKAFKMRGEVKADI